MQLTIHFMVDRFTNNSRETISCYNLLHAFLYFKHEHRTGNGEMFTLKISWPVSAQDPGNISQTPQLVHLHWSSEVLWGRPTWKPHPWLRSLPRWSNQGLSNKKWCQYIHYIDLNTRNTTLGNIANFRPYTSWCVASLQVNLKQPEVKRKGNDSVNRAGLHIPVWWLVVAGGKWAACWS